MNKMIAFLLLSLIVLTACGVMPGDADQKLILKDHVLSGKIWDVKNGQFVEKAEFLAGINRGDYILLGETHDNLLHHEYQSLVINEMYKSGASTVVAFEMINSAQGEIIEGKQYSSSNALIDDLNQVKSTWKYEQRYKPVFDSILKAGFPILAANLDRLTIMAIARKGEENIPEHLKPYLEKNVLTDEQKKALINEIKMSHCGMENPHMTQAMMLTQQVKDAAMADRLIQNDEMEKRILIAGSGHVRNDRGVPIFIRGEKKDAKIVAVAWLEVVNEINNVEQYARRWGGEMMPFDYVWFTPRMDRPDPCKSFRQHMKARNKSMENNSEK